MKDQKMENQKIKNQKWINRIAGYAVIYTVITLLNSILYLSSGIYEDPSGNWHELDRAVITFIGVMAFELCTGSSVKPLILRYAIAYVPSQLTAFAYVWMSGFREPLAESAYRDIWINFTGFFILLCTVSTVISIHKEKKMVPDAA